MIVGYARVSTADQNAEAQQAELESAGCERIYMDHGVSGTKSSRPELDRMMEHLRSGDTLVVWKLDRLGRNTRNLLDLLDRLTERGVSFRSLRDGITLSGQGDSAGDAMTRAMLTIMSAFATLERDQISERTKAGLETARKQGRKGGRREVLATDPDVSKARELHLKGLSVEDIGKHLARDVKRKDGTTDRNVPLSRATVYRYLSI